jgi:hypothetical protein
MIMKKQLLFNLLLFIGVLASTQNLFSQTVTPIAHWKFNEGDGTSVVDSESGFTGELMGETAFDATEKKEGSSLMFNGTSDYVQTDLLTEIQEAENVTFMTWFNTNVVEVTQQHVFWIGDVAGNGWGGQQEINITINHFNADLQNSNICLFYGSSDDKTPNNVNIVSSDAVFAAGEWHHLAGVIKNMSGIDGPTEAELYLDGVMVTPYDWATTTYGFACSNTTTELIDRSTWNTALRIGMGGVETRQFNGYLDEVKIFDMALTDQEIKGAMIVEGTNASRILKNESIVYPSRVIDYLTIKNNSNIVSVEIVDLLGNNVLRTSSQPTINVSHLQKGVYFVKLNGKSGTTTQKIVKQ